MKIKFKSKKNEIKDEKFSNPVIIHTWEPSEGKKLRLGRNTKK